MTQLLIKLFHFFKTRRILLSLIILLIFVGSGFLILRLNFEEDITRIFPKNQQLDRIGNIFREFDFIDKLVITVSAETSEKEIQPEQLIEYADKLEDSLRKNLSPDYVSAVLVSGGADQMNKIYDLIYKNIPIFLDEKDYRSIDSLILEETIDQSVRRNYKTLVSPASSIFKKYIVLDPLNFTSLGLTKLQEFQVSENFIIHQNHFFSSDLKHLFLFVTPASSSGETRKNSHMLNLIDKYILDLEKSIEGVTAEYYGGVAVAVGNANRIKKDIALTISIAVVLILLMIGLFYRRFLLFFVIFLPALFGASLSLGVISFLSNNISAISLAIGSVLLGITIDYALHFFTHHKHVHSVNQVLDDIASPILMSSLTTASAFLCLLLIGSGVLKDLGLFAAFSVIAASVFTLTVLPHFVKKSTEKRSSERIGFINKLAGYQYDKNKVIVGGVLLISILCLFSFRKVGFEGDMYAMNYMSTELTRAEKNLSQLTDLTLNSTYIISEGKTLDEALLRNEKLLPELEELKKEGIISNYISMSSFFVSKATQEKRIKRWDEYWSAEKKDKIYSNLLSAGSKYHFNESAFSGIKKMLDQEYQPLPDNEIFHPDFGMFNDWFVQTEKGVLIANQVKIKRESKQIIYSRFADKEPIIFDKSFITDKLIEILRSNFKILLIISLSLVFSFLLLYFGRVELAVISFIPILLSWLWTLGIMGILGIKFTIFNVIISTFVFGLGIDYSLFIMRGLLQEYKFDYKNFNSYKTSILLSGATTIIGIGVLIFAKHPALQSIAAVSIVGIFSVIIISYTVQPILFRNLVGNVRDRRAFPVTAGEIIVWFYRMFILIMFHLIFIIPSIICLGLPVVKRKRNEFLLTVIHFFSKIILITLGYSGKANKHLTEFSGKRVVYLVESKQLWEQLFLHACNKQVVSIEQNDNPSRSLFRLFFGIPYRLSGYYYPKKDSTDNFQAIDSTTSLIYSCRTDNQIQHGFPKINEFLISLSVEYQLVLLPIFVTRIGAWYHTTPPSILFGKIRIGKADTISFSRNPTNDILSDQINIRNEKIQTQFNSFRHRFNKPEQLRKYLLRNYIFKGPILEWYLRIKTRLEKNYRVFHEILPEEGKITDIGCGYGSMAYMLGLLSPGRFIYGIDYDKKKIRVANHCHAKNDHIVFTHGDIGDMDFQESNVFIISDVLHYLPFAMQETVIKKCASKLIPGGRIVIREGDSELKSRHIMTRLSEFFSTRLGFNKTMGGEGILYFPTRTHLIKLLSECGLNANIIDNTRLTSNLIVIAERNRE